MQHLSITFKQPQAILLMIAISMTVFTAFYSGKTPTALHTQEPGPEFVNVAYPQLDASALRGRLLFRNLCGACHTQNLEHSTTSPALLKVEERWADFPEEDLYRWIRNSQQLIEEKHPKAIELWEKWQPRTMVDFPNLTDPEIKDILHFIRSYEIITNGKLPT